MNRIPRITRATSGAIGLRRKRALAGYTVAPPGDGLTGPAGNPTGTTRYSEQGQLSWTLRTSQRWSGANVRQRDVSVVSRSMPVATAAGRSAWT
jgi:hypothetical protein